MQNRKAIILSLGMLLEKVDTSSFIGKLSQKAKEENSKFEFSLFLQSKAFGLSEQFNQGKIDCTEFEKQALELFGIKNLPKTEFWDAWHKMIKIGQISDKLKLLQEVAQNNNALIYLLSDTNRIHLLNIIQECETQQIKVNFGKDRMMLVNQFPLYASCELGKTRQDLIKHVIADIKAKEFNKPNTITLVLGNSENIKDINHKRMAQKECDAISTWCKDNNVAVTLHNNSLNDTLTQAFTAEVPKKPSVNIFGW